MTTNLVLAKAEKAKKLEEKKRTNVKLLIVASNLFENNDREGAAVILNSLKDFKLEKKEWDQLISDKAISQTFAEICILELNMIKKGKPYGANSTNYIDLCGYPSLKKVVTATADLNLATAGRNLRTAVENMLKEREEDLKVLASRGYRFTHYLKRDKETEEVEPQP